MRAVQKNNVKPGPNAPEFKLGDEVALRKRHPCGENRWRVIRDGADVKLRCMGCGRVVMLDRMELLHSIRRVLEKGDGENGENRKC